MKPHVLHLPVGDNPPKASLYYGINVLNGLGLLPDASVHMICTSPPYWALRDYKTENMLWGDDPKCDHVWVDDTCSICGGWLGQLGLEQTPDLYVQHIVEVFQKAKRVLRPDGTLWLNLGDTYWAGGSTTRQGQDPRRYVDKSTLESQPTEGQCERPIKTRNHPILKQKDLVGIPWRVALALQEDGWYLRNDIIWSKMSCMPESVRDRCTRSHEYIFLFAHPESRGRYFYDADAIREPHRSRGDVKPWKMRDYDQTMLPDGHRQNSGQYGKPVKGRPKGIAGFGQGGRNKRTVWNVNPRPYVGAHFAVWPPDLVETMILAGTSERGVCKGCGSPYRRIVEKPSPPRTRKAGPNQRGADWTVEHGFDLGGMSHFQYDKWLKTNPPRTTGWEPTCECQNPDVSKPIVLDPFSGSGTTGMVALQLDRDYIGLDLNADYLSLAKARILCDKAPEATPQDDGTVLDIFG